ncbi:transporter substrate-binding domain-containing protein [Pseudomonas sp. TB1-B1]|uniref:transporter substrate-binding domain-containing protein n=1 Tax=Pseudomonas sp. TB1-B1 TaxID=2985515 RepID=UPI00226F0351|nr:transporter substrate-binding domain-containing protein [Pseudomonas sp. TB1-B1]MCX9150083.1 transporter substrate-binding domain-containing protein [Pseudomonas sp. TB1-B1]
MKTISSELRRSFALKEELRVVINYGNPILAHRPLSGDEPQGVSVDIARRLAQALSLRLHLVTVDTAGFAVKAVENGEADVGFFAIDPVRGAQIAFTSPYVIIEGCYLVRDSFPAHSLNDIDVAGNRIAVGEGSAYDLFLTREIQHATLFRAPSSPAVVNTFIEQNLEVAAGVRQQLESDRNSNPGLRLIQEPFMQIRQAMGVPKARGQQASVWLDDFIRNLIAEGFIHDALLRHSITGVTVP